MSRKIKMKRGLKLQLPTLDAAEFGFTTDTKQTFIGSDSGNVELAKQAELAQFKTDTNESLTGKVESADFNKFKEEATTQLAETSQQVTDLGTNKAEKTEVNALATEKANGTDLLVERERINNLMALPDGSTTNDARLEDIAIGADGVTYTNPGEAVRKQFDNVENLLMNGKQNLYFSDWKTGSISGSNGSPITQSTGYMYTTNYHAANGETLEINAVNGFTVSVAQYGTGYAFVSRPAYITGKQTIKPTQPFYRITFGTIAGTTPVTTADLVNITITKSVATKASNEITTVDNKVSTLQQNILNSFKDGAWIENASYNPWSSGAIDGSGNKNSVNAFISTTNFQTEEVGTILKATTVSPFSVAIAQYDENYVFKSRTSYAQSQGLTLNHPNYKITFGFADGVTPVTTNELVNLSVTKERKIKVVNEKLYGKTVYGFGTSITHGHTLGSAYLDYLAQDEGLILTNYAVNGAKAMGYGIGTQVAGASTTVPDYVVVEGFANDYYPETVGTAEVSKLTVAAVPTTVGNITVTLNGVTKNIAVDPSIDTTIDAVATKIRNTVFTGWTTSGTGANVTFTATSVGSKTDATYSAGATGATGTMTTTTQGQGPTLNGTLISGYDTSTIDVYSFAGRVEQLFNLLLTKYVGAKIILLLDHKLVGRNFTAQEDLVKITLEAARKWGISVVNLYHESNFNTHITAYKNNYTYDDIAIGNNGSGTHPNETGYRKFYLPPLKAKMLELS